MESRNLLSTTKMLAAVDAAADIEIQAPAPQCKVIDIVTNVGVQATMPKFAEQSPVPSPKNLLGN